VRSKAAFLATSSAYLFKGTPIFFAIATWEAERVTDFLDGLELFLPAEATTGLF